MKIKAIIFDMDGTIIDTSHIWNKVTHNLIKSKKPEISNEKIEEILAKIHGLALKPICQFIKENLNLEDNLEDIVKEKNLIIKNLYKDIKFINGFETFHNSIKNKNLICAIATNADLHSLSLAKNLLNLESFFGNNIYDISLVNEVCKPNPDIYLYALEKIKLNINNTIAVEDSYNGIKAAKAAGLFCIAINTSDNREKLKEADCIVDSYHEIDLQDISNKYF